MAIYDENQVIRDVVNGDAPAFRRLVERYETRVFRFIRSFVKDEHECEDLAQDVFLSAYGNLSSYSTDHASFSTWLFTIARNRCLNHLRRKRLLTGKMIDSFESARTPVKDATEAEFLEQLDCALSSIPWDQRTAFVLFEIEGLSYDEIARVENVQLGTVRSRISRAKKKLRSILSSVGSKL